ncbi:MAG: hypothetical protein A2Y92_01875, partial [Chloroflexi bacterium RBG_13_57_8]
EKLLPLAMNFHCRPIRRELKKGIRTVLDIGCGKGLVAGGIREKGIFMVGADIFEPDLRTAREKNAHDGHVLADARFLPFREKSFDAVMCLELIEHLDKEEGLRFIRNAEAIAVRKVIISTPVGFLDVNSGADACGQEKGNPYQHHKGGWEPGELRALGYKVYYNDYMHRLEKFFADRQSTWAWLASAAVFTLLAPLNWLSPGFGSHLFCVKEIDPVR